MTRTYEAAWWYWLGTLVLLTSAVFWERTGIFLAILLCGIQLLHFGWRTRSLTAFPIQVRAVYMGLMLLGLWPPLQWIHLTQLVGTAARVLVGYCLLARTLSLTPWNRSEPISPALLRHTFLALQPTVAPCGTALLRPAFEGEERS